jgi:outer membrane lipoprotein-sorting protein
LIGQVGGGIMSRRGNPVIGDKTMTAVSRRLLVAIVILGFGRIASAQTADEIVEKYLTALGGRAALAKLTSRSTTGTMTLTTPAGAVSGTIEVWNEQPNKSRTLLKLDLTSLGAGPMTRDQRFDGTTAYVLDNLQGNREITGAQLENMKNAVFPSPFLNYKERGGTVELAGKEKVAGRDAYVLIYKPKTGSPVRQYVDVESYLPVRLVVQVDIPQMGQVEQTSDLSDFRDVDGVKVPFTINVASEVQNFTISVTKVEHNAKIDPALFSKPAEK